MAAFSASEQGETNDKAMWKIESAADGCISNGSTPVDFTGDGPVDDRHNRRKSY